MPILGNTDERISYVDYDLIVEEDDTEVLVNIPKKDYNDIYRFFQIIPINNDTIISNEENGTNTLQSVSSKGYIKSYLRTVLRKGKYKLRFTQHWVENKKCDRPQFFSDYLENDKNDFLFRFAASKQCNVRKFDESKMRN